MEKIHPQIANRIHLVAVIKKHPPLSQSWNKAAGIARNKKELLEAHVKSMQKEWK